MFRGVTTNIFQARTKGLLCWSVTNISEMFVFGLWSKKYFRPVRMVSCPYSKKKRNKWWFFVKNNLFCDRLKSLLCMSVLDDVIDGSWEKDTENSAAVMSLSTFIHSNDFNRTCLKPGLSYWHMVPEGLLENFGETAVSYRSYLWLRPWCFTSKQSGLHKSKREQHKA